MRNLLLLFSLFFVFPSLGQNHQSDEQIVNSFVKEWIGTSGSEVCALKYMNIHESQLQDEEKKRLFFLTFSFIGNLLKDEIMKSDEKFQIISHENNKGNDMIKKFNLKTDDYSGVYYLIIDGKVITPIIVKEGRIVSYSQVWIHVDINKFNKPWFINQPDQNFKE
jgi:hypothetical protein